MKVAWQKTTDGDWRAELPGDVTLSASPDNRKFGKPARGTAWRAGVSHWDAATRTISRFGRDVYGQKLASADEAKRLAEEVYAEVGVTL